MDVREELERQMCEVDEDMNLYPSNIDRIVELSNQRVIEELESIKNQCRFYSDRLIGGQAYGFNEINSIVTKRIKELKQD